MKIRLLLQPVTAGLFAIRAGLRDLRKGRRPYVWALVRERSRQREMLAEGWKDVGRVFVVAVVIDLIYQAVVIHAFRPGEALIVGVVLAIVPYLIFREVVNRILSGRSGRPPGTI